jgi:hypothetical protein
MIELYDLKGALNDVLDRYSAEKGNPTFLDRLKIVKLVSNGIVDQYALALQARLRFPIQIPPSLLYDLAAISSAEYGTNFIRGK